MSGECLFTTRRSLLACAFAQHVLQTADHVKNVVQLPAVLRYLRNLPEADLTKKLVALAKERLKFAYRHKLSKTLTATSVIMSEMCSKYNLNPTAQPNRAEAVEEG